LSKLWPRKILGYIWKAVSALSIEGSIHLVPKGKTIHAIQQLIHLSVFLPGRVPESHHLGFDIRGGWTRGRFFAIAFSQSAGGWQGFVLVGCKAAMAAVLLPISLIVVVPWLMTSSPSG
jgi:hypothetical protein